MDLYMESCYKTVIRQRVKELSKIKPGINLKRIASQVPIQYTYFSKVLNDDATHFNEDHLFSICFLLEFYPEETDYIFLLRSKEIAKNLRRKSFLENRLERIRKAQKLNASIQDANSQSLHQETNYLFDPICILVHVSLHILEYRQNPRRLCQPLGISPKRLQEVLHRLNQLGFIEIDAGGRVDKVKKGHIHYSTDHPLMRIHQNLLRTLSAGKLLQLPDSDRYNFMVTFSTNETTVRLVKEAFQEFIKKVESLAVDGTDQSTYQLNFDLFKWA